MLEVTCQDKTSDATAGGQMPCRPLQEESFYPHLERVRGRSLRSHFKLPAPGSDY